MYLKVTIDSSVVIFCAASTLVIVQNALITIPLTKKLALFRHLYVQYVAKCDIIDIIIVHPLAKMSVMVTVQRFHCSYYVMTLTS